MKKNTLFFIVIIVVSIVFLGTVRNYNNKSDAAYYSMKFRNIEFNLVELEGAIQFQRDNNWTTPFAVTEKVQDVIEGINITLIVSKDIGKLTRENEDTLSLLLKIISKYDKYGDYPTEAKNFTTKDQQAFTKLADDLKKAGWGMGEGFGKDDRSFREGVNNLYNYQKEQ